MSSRSKRYVIGPAAASDGPAILALLEEESSKGAVLLTYTRRPDPLAASHRDCDADIVVGRDADSGRVVSLGICDYRDLYVNGSTQRVGYFHSMRVARDHRRSFPASWGFDALCDRARGRGVRYFISTILDGNDEGRRVLEKKRERLPWFEYLCGYDVYAVKTGRSRKLPAGYALRSAGVENIEGIIAFVNKIGTSRQFYPVLTVDDIMCGRYPGLDPGCFRVLESSHGEILAVGAVWDQSSYKQYLVSGYRGLLRVLYPISFALPLFGLPVLPKPGSTLRFFTLSFCASTSPDAFGYFLDALTSECGNWPFLLTGVARGDAAADVVARRRHITYSSRLYLVNVDKEPGLMGSLDPARTPYVECGLL